MTNYRRIKDLRTAEDVREGMTYDEKYDLIEAAERKEEDELREATISSIEDYNAIQLTIIEDEEKQVREAIARSTREADKEEDDDEERQVREAMERSTREVEEEEQIRLAMELSLREAPPPNLFKGSSTTKLVRPS